MNWYNEIDPAAAHILRSLIADGVLPPGDVDTRSIKDVMPDDLDGYAQCHFFAGGGLWSVAARLAGWPDDRPLWTGSCPCQPFSAAGKGLGTDDPRHLWPDFHRLISARRPAVVMGEQVAGAPGYGWFDGVRTDLESEGYASRAVDFPACSVDAPHQRNRLYWIATDGRVANYDGCGSSTQRRDVGEVGSLSEAQCRAEHDATLSGRGDDQVVRHVSGARQFGSLDYGLGTGLEGYTGHGDGGRRSEQGRPVATPDGAGTASDVANNQSGGSGSGLCEGGQEQYRNVVTDGHGGNGLYADADRGGCAGRQESPERQALGRTAFERHLLRNGTYWSNAEWLVCHDGKARRAEPGIRLLVDGLPGRVDLWRVGGNAIVPEAAAEVIRAFLDVEGIAA